MSSITTISGASNGSTLTYLFGADPKTGLMRKQSLATGLVLAVEAYAFATGGIQEDIYNFDLDHWGFTRNPGETLADYLGRVSRSRFIRGKDNALYSLTLQGAYADNAEWKTWPGVRFKLMWKVDQAACCKSPAQYASHWRFARLSRNASMWSAFAARHQAPGRFNRCWAI